MSITIHRTPWIDDDGTGTTGTVINNAVKQELYDEIDGALAQLLPSSGGIKFPPVQVPSSDPTTLDDYREGNWVPAIGGDGGASSGQTYSGQSGLYVKVGRLVTCWFEVSLSAKGAIPGNVQVQNLPFPIENIPAGIYRAPVIEFNNLATPWIRLGATPPAAGATSFTFLAIDGAAISSMSKVLTVNDLTDSSYFGGMFIYRAAA